MPYTPVFFETRDGTQQIRVVDRIRANLFKKGIKPLPFADTISELQHILKFLPASGFQPCLFVVNTFEAEDKLSELDRAMGETPVLFFRRELMWLKAAPGSVEDLGVTTRISKMQPRLSGLWYYGALNFDQVALRASQRIEQFLGHQDFRCFEESLRFSPSGRLPRARETSA